MVAAKDIWFRNRRIGTRPIRGCDLIICGGAQTEVNYFISVAKWLEGESNGAAKFFVECNADSPLNMARNAQSIKTQVETRESVKIDNVWVAFDKDEFGEFDNAIMQIDSN